MDTKKELKILFWMIVVFVAVFFMPLGSERFMTAVDATFDPVSYTHLDVYKRQIQSVIHKIV